LTMVFTCGPFSWELAAATPPHVPVQKFDAQSSTVPEYIEPSATSGTATAVVVGDIPLVHTAQMLPLNPRGELIEEPTLDAQIAHVLAKLDQVLRSAQSELRLVVKLNVYLSKAEDLQPVQGALSRCFTSPAKPAASFVVGNLAVPGARVAMDAIAPVGAKKIGPGSTISVINENGCTQAAVLAAGGKVYVSGMADTNALPIATRKTLEKLIAAIAHLGLNKSHIVQLKSFLQPMSEVATVRKEIVNFFGGQAPPLVFVDWISKAPNPPIEIELIATAAGDFSREADSVSFITPPGTTGSKVYSRVARVNHGKLIFFSGLYGMKSETGAAQIREIFGTIKGVLAKCGSDLEHLAKATYYVSDDEASNQLNQIRPEFFNPQRPPTASKAKVTSVGMPGKTITLDMIAVTKD
jgi:enamine deaminase RidA (YjgF/YER057c/UK114 family)